MDYKEHQKIVFEGEEFQQSRSFQRSTPKIVQWVIKYSGGLVKDEKQANYVLLGFVVVAVVISLFLFFSDGEKNTLPPKNIIDNTLNTTIQNLPN